MLTTRLCRSNEALTNIIYSTEVRTTERWMADADPHNILEPPIDGGCLCSGPIFLVVVISRLSTWYNIDDTKPVGWIKRDGLWY